MPATPPDIEAEIRFLTTAEGGREGPCRSGGVYRPVHDFGLGDALLGALYDFVGREWVHPGETVVARLRLIAPELLAGRLAQGHPFTVQEGRRVVGTGRVTRVLNPALRRPSS